MEANLCGKHNANVAEIKELNEKPSILNSSNYTGGPDGDAGSAARLGMRSVGEGNNNGIKPVIVFGESIEGVHCVESAERKSMDEFSELGITWTPTVEMHDLNETAVVELDSNKSDAFLLNTEIEIVAPLLENICTNNTPNAEDSIIGEQSWKYNSVNLDLILKKLKNLEINMGQLANENQGISVDLESYSQELQTITKSVRRNTIERAKAGVRTKNYFEDIFDTLGSEMGEFKNSLFDQVKEMITEFDTTIRDHRNQITAELNEVRANLERAVSQDSNTDLVKTLPPRDTFDSVEDELEYRRLELEKTHAQIRYWKKCHERKNEMLAHDSSYDKKCQELYEELHIRECVLQSLRQRLGAKPASVPASSGRFQRNSVRFQAPSNSMNKWNK